MPAKKTVPAVLNGKLYTCKVSKKSATCTLEQRVGRIKNKVGVKQATFVLSFKDSVTAKLRQYGVDLAAESLHAMVSEGIVKERTLRWRANKAKTAVTVTTNRVPGSAADLARARSLLIKMLGKLKYRVVDEDSESSALTFFGL